MPKIPTSAPSLANMSVNQPSIPGGGGQVRKAYARLGATISKAAGEAAVIVDRFMDQKNDEDKFLDYQGRVLQKTLELQDKYNETGQTWKNFHLEWKSEADKIALDYEGEDFEKRRKRFMVSKTFAIQNSARDNEGRRVKALVDVGMQKAANNMRLTTDPLEQREIWLLEKESIKKNAKMSLSTPEAMMKQKQFSELAASTVLNGMLQNKDYDTGITVLTGQDHALNDILAEGLSPDKYNQWVNKFTRAKQNDTDANLEKYRAMDKEGTKRIFTGKAVANSSEETKTEKYFQNAAQQIRQMPDGEQKTQMAIKLTNNRVATDVHQKIKNMRSPASWILPVQEAEFVGSEEQKTAAREKLRAYVTKAAKEALADPIQYAAGKDEEFESQMLETLTPLNRYNDPSDGIYLAKNYITSARTKQKMLGVGESNYKYLSKNMVAHYKQEFASATGIGEMSFLMNDLEAKYNHFGGSPYFSVTDQLREAGVIEGGLGAYPSMSDSVAKETLIRDYADRENIRKLASPASKKAVTKAITEGVSFNRMYASFDKAERKNLAPDFQEAIELYALARVKPNDDSDRVKKIVSNGVKLYFDNNFEEINNVNGGPDLLIPENPSRLVSNKLVNKFVKSFRENVRFAGIDKFKNDSEDQDTFMKSLQRDHFWKVTNDMRGMKLYRKSAKGIIPARRGNQEFVVEFDDMPDWIGQFNAKRSKMEALIEQEDTASLMRRAEELANQMRR